ncbi:DUF58 domain-containing protein [Polycladidibacter hongkongensis]|uniref:DUF58 domain-containing protein n=1 Tax=Polycladidibacter hongkongensis TaxID=1647556 RepID=UPI00082D80DB|nr:DUF58 domain-containing protein [Pseudovibrio hongkongensis]
MVSSALSSTPAQTDSQVPCALPQALQLAQRLPEIMLEASRIAQSVAAGAHQRKQAGQGENFWQYRPFSSGEPAQRIDWRRSARDNHLYVREQEWQTSQHIWIWPDLSPSMQFRSSNTLPSKAERATVLMLALAEVLAKAGEQVGLPDAPLRPRRLDAAAQLAHALAARAQHHPLPSALPEKRRASLLICSDFLGDTATLATCLAKASAKGISGHLIQILDPAEETFPFTGATRFIDPTTRQSLTGEKAQEWQTAYCNRLAAHKHQLQALAVQHGFSYTCLHTDTPASSGALAIHAALSGHAAQADRRA